MVEDDETLFGVCCGSEVPAEVEPNKAAFSSDDDGSTITDLLEAGVLVMIVDVAVMFDDVTDVGVV
jgi:hypothetical protein